MSDWREDRVGSALRGENPMVMARMRSGFAVIGDTQFLLGYCVLLAGDPGVSHLTDLDRSALGGSSSTWRCWGRRSRTCGGASACGG